jgi:hypothetical protein
VALKPCFFKGYFFLFYRFLSEFILGTSTEERKNGTGITKYNKVPPYQGGKLSDSEVGGFLKELFSYF